jgi:hypothetical protein
MFSDGEKTIYNLTIHLTYDWKKCIAFLVQKNAEMKLANSNTNYGNRHKIYI